MTSTVETALTPNDLTATTAAPAGDPWPLREAMVAERHAYESMRELVPDLALPRERRGALTAEQQAAVTAYQELRDRLEVLRSARRSLGLSQDDDQSV